MTKPRWNISLKQWILLGINIACLVGWLILLLVAHQKQDTLYSQQAAKRWENKGESYAQVSAFFSPERKTQTDGVREIRNSLLQKLAEDSLYDKESTNRVMIDAYSGECEAQIRKDTNSLTVTAVGVGNDFFKFHPIPLISGSYISGEDLNQDRVVLDENLAWALFGSNDIVGMQLWMDNNVYVVAGVVAVDEDKLYKTAYGTGNRMYMMYDTLKAHQENLNITCYEAVMPNPISNYAFYALKSACGQGETDDTDEMKDAEKNPLNFDNCEIIENSNRFENLVLLENFTKSKYKSMRTNSVGYPYWENIARVIVDNALCLLFIRGILLLVPILSLLVFVYKLWKARTWTVKGIFYGWVEQIQEKRARQEEEKQQMLLQQESTEDDIEEDEMSEETENAQEDEADAFSKEETFFQSEDWNESDLEEDS